MPGAAVDRQAQVEAIVGAAILPSKELTLEQEVFNRIDRDAQFVLIGEASHGTHDFYHMRAELTKRLIAERGFSAVVAEADWPDAFRANLYVRGLSTDKTADEALAEFKRFPTWMWRNDVVLHFIEWLKAHNDGLDPHTRRRTCGGVGFYGMDLYSLHSSAHRVIEVLEKADPEAAARAKERYRCFDRYGADTMSYAAAVGVHGRRPCVEEAVAELVEVTRRAAALGAALDEGAHGEEVAFSARANAAVVQDAEEYYRNMFFGEELTWNLRDRHFLECVRMTREHLATRVLVGPEPKLVLWAHNSHVGDARHTDMGQARGEVNLGQLVREAYGPGRVAIVGLTTHTGTVTAADDWDSAVLCKQVRASLPGSYESLLHAAAGELHRRHGGGGRGRAGGAGAGHRFALDFRHGERRALAEALEGPLLQRFIGVIYRPRTERQSHYSFSSLPRQYDLVVHLDRTRALHPLERHGTWEVARMEDADETFPFGL